ASSGSACVGSGDAAPRRGRAQPCAHGRVEPRRGRSAPVLGSCRGAIRGGVPGRDPSQGPREARYRIRRCCVVSVGFWLAVEAEATFRALRRDARELELLALRRLKAVLRAATKTPLYQP